MLPSKNLVLAAVVAICGCSSTKVLSTWRDPAIGQLAFRKMLVVAPNESPGLRRSAEDELARRIIGAEAVPSYRLVPDAELGNNEVIRARARDAGFDGVVVMRLVSVDRRASWSPPFGGSLIGPYYAYGGWPTFNPGFMQVDTYVRLDTNVYTLPDDKLVWASASRTVNPSSVRSLVASTARAVAKEMRRQGLVP